ncbi:hypothetical protein PTKU46_04830 [Paraburkholderia terrae]
MEDAVSGAKETGKKAAETRRECTRRTAAGAARNGRDATCAPLQSVETRCPNEGRAIAARLVNNEATDTLRGFRISEPTLR